jgi:putative ABC transport system permease protein
MNLLLLTWRNLTHRISGALLSLLLLSLSVGIISLLLLIQSQLERHFTDNVKGIDMVVGAKGSPMQLILSSVFHLDIPNGNIPLEEAEKLQKHPLVKSSIPVALGDNYNGFRIVGTNSDYINHYDGKLAGGKLFAEEMEVVIGSEVAAKYGNKLGDKIVGAHGLVGSDDLHTDNPYTIVGILAPTNTVLDRLVLTPVESVWHVHEHEEEHESEHQGEHKHESKEEHHHDDEHENHEKHKHEEHDEHEGKEITSLLITYKSPLAASVLPREINKESSLQSASPAFEVARLNSFMGVGADTLKTFGWYLIALAGFGIFVALYNAMNERRYDLALMRSFGATPSKLFRLVITESLILAVIGAILGIALGHAFVEVASSWLADAKHINITGKLFLPEEIWLIGASIVIGLVAAIIPAIRVYRIDIFKTLVKG